MKKILAITTFLSVVLCSSAFASEPPTGPNLASVSTMTIEAANPNYWSETDIARAKQLIEATVLVSLALHVFALHIIVRNLTQAERIRTWVDVASGKRIATIITVSPTVDHLAIHAVAVK